MSSNLIFCTKWRYGVTASSLGSYPWGPGSIPGIATLKKNKINYENNGRI